MFNKFRHWYHHKRFNKIVRLLASEPIGSYTNAEGQQSTIHLTDYFMLVEKPCEDDPSCDGIYMVWRDLERQDDIDLNMDADIEKHRHVEYWHLSVDNTENFIVKNFLKNAKEKIEDFMAIKEMKRAEPYLKDYKCWLTSGKIVCVELTPYQIEGYIASIKAAHPDIDEAIINTLRNDYISEFAMYSTATADEPRVSCVCFPEWYEYKYKVRVELEKRNNECKAVLDEIKSVREARKEKKDA